MPVEPSTQSIEEDANCNTLMEDVSRMVVCCTGNIRLGQMHLGTWKQPTLEPRCGQWTEECYIVVRMQTWKKPVKK